MALIKATPDPFGGVIIDAEVLTDQPDSFQRDLQESVSTWHGEQIKVVWLDLPISHVALVPVAVAAGFEYHHAETHRIQLTLRLVPGSYIPPYATHYIGAGGVVIRDGGELLVVSERYRRRRGRHYKLPGGALGPGEHIEACVRREVLEETGIHTRFRSLVCFRHWHGYRYGKSDIYFVCRLEPLTFDIRPDPTEIDECLWMPVDEYLRHPDVHQFNRRIVSAALESPGLSTAAIDGYGTPETHEFFMPE
jgi:8-oxo-dGTP pyrophosphatase MutT (NUDIX family)